MVLASPRTLAPSFTILCNNSSHGIDRGTVWRVFIYIIHPFNCRSSLPHSPRAPVPFDVSGHEINRGTATLGISKPEEPCVTTGIPQKTLQLTVTQDRYIAIRHNVKSSTPTEPSWQNPASGRHLSLGAISQKRIKQPVGKRARRPRMDTRRLTRSVVPPLLSSALSPGEASFSYMTWLAQIQTDKDQSLTRQVDLSISKALRDNFIFDSRQSNLSRDRQRPALICHGGTSAATLSSTMSLNTTYCDRVRKSRPVVQINAPEPPT